MVAQPDLPVSAGSPEGEALLTRYLDQVRLLAEEGARLVVLPEVTFELPDDDPLAHLRPFARLASEHDVTIVVGAAGRAPGRVVDDAPGGAADPAAGQPANLALVFGALGRLQPDADGNRDGVINEDDRVVLGDPNPRYMFGLNLNGAWRGFDAGLFFQGIGKRDQYLALGFIQGPVWENFTSTWHNSYYDPERDNQGARHPTWYANENRNYYTTNSHWILDGSFLKLRNAQLGYTMPASVTDRLGTSRLRVYISGKNLWMRNKLGIDLDPEYSAVRGDIYPQTRVFSIGTDISF